MYVNHVINGDCSVGETICRQERETLKNTTGLFVILCLCLSVSLAVQLTDRGSWKDNLDKQSLLRYLGLHSAFTFHPSKVKKKWNYKIFEIPGSTKHPTPIWPSICGTLKSGLLLEWSQILDQARHLYLRKKILNLLRPWLSSAYNAKLSLLSFCHKELSKKKMF